MRKILIMFILVLTVFVAPMRVQAAEDIDFKELFDNHQSVMLIIHPITGDIHYANPAAATFYGYPLETLMEMSINQINTLTPEEVAAERLKALNEERNFFIFKHRLANGDIKTVHVYSYPIEIDGEAYLFSIIIDQTEFILLQNRQNNLTMMIIILLILGIITTTAGFIIIHRKKKSLKESEQRFEALHNASFGGIVIHNQGIILDCNKGLSDITGYAHEELIGMNGLLLIVPDQRDFVMDKIKSGYELPYETHGVRKNGEIYPVRIEARNIPYKGKQVRITEFRDITELKKQEEEKQELYRQHSLLISELPIGLAVHEMIYDDEGKPIDYRFLSINNGFEKLTGLKKENLIGKTVLEVLPNTEQHWIDFYGEVVSTGKNKHMENYSQELGKYFAVNAYSPQKGRFAVMVEDITEKTQKEQELINSENEKGRIIDSLPGVFYKCKFDDDWTMLYMSEQCETLTGYKTEELINNKVLSFNDLILPQYRDYLMKSWLASKTQNQTNIVQYEITKKDGTTAWIWEKGKAFEQNGEWFIEGFLMDVTVQKKYQDDILYTSKHDFLTGLPNRRYFDEKIKELDKPENYPLLVAMMDIDGLKLINDTYGHQVGDQAIKQVSELLKVCCGETAFIARVGGDEFLIISPMTTVSEYKEKRNELIAKISQIKINDIQLSLSFGAAVKTEQSINIGDVITDAENNMYSNKVLHSQSSRNQTINAIFESLKEKHDEERIHSDRVSRYCALMGEKLKLSHNDQLELSLAGRMHDIGKITIPDQILKKPGKLTDEEWVIMKTHTTNGYQILRSADHYSRLAEYALTHHERIDGKGYPQGLKGDDIPLFSRIICICDAYEAMTADRPYRKAFSKEVAIEELKRCAGTQFDANLVELFIREVLEHE